MYSIKTLSSLVFHVMQFLHEVKLVTINHLSEITNHVTKCYSNHRTFSLHEWNLVHSHSHLHCHNYFQALSFLTSFLRVCHCLPLKVNYVALYPIHIINFDVLEGPLPSNKLTHCLNHYCIWVKNMMYGNDQF